MDDENDDTGPIPTIEPPTRYPRHITPGPLRSRYDHVHRLHHQLQDLWHFQLKNHRDPWSIQAAHDYWRCHGPARTLDGRKFGWNPDGNWILDAIADTENELADLEVDAKKRMRAIGVVMGKNRTRVSAPVKSRRLSGGGGGGGGGGVALLDKHWMRQEREMGFTSDTRYQNAACGLNQYSSAVGAPCLQSSSFAYDDNYITTSNNAYERTKLLGSPEKPIIIDDDNNDNHKATRKDKDNTDYIPYFRTFGETAARPSSPATNDNDGDDDDDNGGLLLGSLQDSPSMTGLDRRSRRSSHHHRLDNSPEYVPGYLPSSVVHDIYCGNETTAAALSISSSKSSNSPKTIQGRDPTPCSNSSSPSKKRIRSEEVEYLGEARCQKSPKRDADLNKDEVSIAAISI